MNIFLYFNTNDHELFINYIIDYQKFIWPKARPNYHKLNYYCTFGSF